MRVFRARAWQQVDKSPPRRRPMGDRGSAAVLGVWAIGALCAVFGVLLAQGTAVVVRHRAAGVADLAALAAADHWTEGADKACVMAGRVAAAQGGRLVRCAVVGEISDITAAASAGLFDAEVRARAGPAEPRVQERPAGARSPKAQSRTSRSAAPPAPGPRSPPEPRSAAP
ncbi:hypothetical protein CP978_18670 [Streptomyces nodosus]|nr:hypothetical protein CP978_18670 [Streptomyces nodosus]